ncbi:MAG: HAD-IC family P-type ATPase [Oscillospiraceae bacterium]|nr:HAD-IC family P-type ATPase [Oscillospiraceae bacterium]
MKFKIMHETRNRIRVRMNQKYMSVEQADILEYYLLSIDGVTSAKVYDRTCGATVIYHCPRENILEALRKFNYETNAAIVPERTGRALNREFEDQMVLRVLVRGAIKLFVPMPLRRIMCLAKSLSYLKKALHSLSHAQLDVDVLDATSIFVSLFRGDWKTASSIMFLLQFSELLEEWTRKKTVDDLARSMSLNIDNVWLLKDGQEISVPIENVQIGDRVVVRTGSMIPLDGHVVEGEAMVNQASMTGDNQKIAQRIANAVGVDEFHAEVLPDDKASFIRAEREAGRKVIMVGDGVNDSPALSEADVGIAIASSSAIAREVADITLTAEDLYALVTLRRLSVGLMERIKRNYNFIMSFNGMLIVLGAVGILPPAASSLLHNGFTLAVTLRSMTNLLD